MDAPTLAVPEHPQTPKDNRVVFRDVSFTYDGAQSPALSHVSFTAEPGETVALVGPSGGGKTTAASLIPRFWDADTGTVEVGGVDVRQIDPHVLMEQVAFVFQNNRLFKASILENVRAARPDASQMCIRDRNKTILMIAHRLKTVRNADQILVLDGGQIVQRGTHSQLMAQEGLYQAFVSGRKESGQWKL